MPVPAKLYLYSKLSKRLDVKKAARVGGREVTMDRFFRIGKAFLLMSFCGLLIFHLAACGQNSTNDSQSETATGTEVTSPATTTAPAEESTAGGEESDSSKKDDLPEFVRSTYLACKEVIEGNGLGLPMGNVTKSTMFDSLFYEFPISNSTFHFQYSDGELYSMSVILSDKDSNSVLKDTIATVIAACDGIDFASASQLMQTLVSSFDGYSISDPVKTDNHRYLLKPPISSLTTDTLEIVPIINQEDFDKSPYSQADAQFMGAKMNKGEKVFIAGKVKNDADLGLSSALEIENDGGRFLVYYDPDDYAGEFEIGKAYVFYGVVSEEYLTLVNGQPYAISGYDGYLSMEYFEEAT